MNLGTRSDSALVSLGLLKKEIRKVTEEPVTAEELKNAKRYLSDSFPLKVDTPGKLADLVVKLRTFGLPSDYWDNYRNWIRETSASEAHYVARNYIRPEEALVVIVGQELALRSREAVAD